jgi:outer membrane protein OmpA-like peptidoglycan-associated protein
MHWYQKALVWVIVIGVGTIGSKFYRLWISQNRTSVKSLVLKYEQAWDDAIKDPLKNPPPSAGARASDFPIGQQSLLRDRFTSVDQKQLPDYEKRLEEESANLDSKYRKAWMQAYQEFDDTPTPAAFAAAHVNKKVLEDRPEIKKRLADTDELWTKKKPRVNLAIDTFSGYCVFRSPEFRKALEKKDSTLVLHLVDDDAKYKERIKTLESGATPLAVFTIDALINNSAGRDEPPASIVLLLDETRGADAIIGYKSAFPNLAALNVPDLKIVGVGDSPSETLVRVARTRPDLDKFTPDEGFVNEDTPEKVLKQFRAARPDEKKAFVLWEPYLSQVLKEFPQAHTLIDSSRYSGYIVDVLVVQKKYLKEHRADVQAVVEAYLEALPSQRTSRNMVRLVLEDSKRLVAKGKSVRELTEEDAEKIVQGIWWKTAGENYGHFRIQEAPSEVSKSVTDMINNITDVLRQTGAIFRRISPTELIDKDTCAELEKKGFQPRDRSRWALNEPIDPITFTRSKSKVNEDDDKVVATLKDVAERMKIHPGYHLEIQGHHTKNEDADALLALNRATATLTWLVTEGGIPANRMKAVALDVAESRGTEEHPASIVTFRIYQTPQ